MMIIVAEPGQRSIHTALTVRKLAEEIRIPRLGVVVNKVSKGLDLSGLTRHLDGLPLLGTLSFDPEIAQADLDGHSPYTGRDPQRAEVSAILDAVAARIGARV
jgi:CO dehydrogenase maturation factor